jgi:hypothetical protein
VIAHPFESTITKRTRNNSDFSYFVTKGNHLIEKETLNSMSTILFISEETDLEYFKKNGSILCKLVSRIDEEGNVSKNNSIPINTFIIEPPSWRERPARDLHNKS